MDGNNARGNHGPYDVLLIESDPDGVSPLVDSFEATDATEEVRVVTDGAEALDLLNQRGDYADGARPDIILLDLHVQGPSGTDILAELNEQPALRRIPVIVLTPSDAAEEVDEFYRPSVNACVQKPASPDAFVRLARAIEDFWLTVARLPPK